MNIIFEIEYYFWRGKFYCVAIYTEGYVNFHNLKQAVFEKFGVGYRDNEFMYYWWGENTLMWLKYNKSSLEVFLLMSSQEMLKQMEEYEKQKAKEGAEKGF